MSASPTTTSPAPGSAKERRRNNLVRTSLTTRDKDDVVHQAQLMDEAGTAWNAVKIGNLEMITKLFPGSNVYAKGPVGENVLHIAMLVNTPSSLAIAKYLVKQYGKTLVNTPFQVRLCETDTPGIYEGQTALHIAIINRDFDMVKFLVSNGADVRTRAYGRFFEPGGVVYHGELPLSFAACTGQKAVVSFLKRHGAFVNADRDTWGNSALHMTVFSGQIEMYDHLTEFCGASEHVRNHAGQTPFLLAASLGKLEMFQHIYNKRRRVAWAYGPLSSYSLSLREIDSVQSNKEYIPSALETIVRKGHPEAIVDPLVQLLLHYKWRRFAAAQFLLQAFLYLVFIITQTFLIWLYCSPNYFNSSSYCALEYVGIIFAALFWGLEILDSIMYVNAVHRRRTVMKRTRVYQPQLYPIPGEMPAQETSRMSFINRITLGMLAEGTERDQPPWRSRPAASHYATPGSSLLWNPDEVQRLPGGGLSHTAPPGGLRYSRAPVRRSVSQPFAGPMVEGLEGGEPSPSATTMPSTVLPPRPPVPPAASAGREDGDRVTPTRIAPSSFADVAAANAVAASLVSPGRQFQRARSMSTTGQPAFLASSAISEEAEEETTPPTPSDLPRVASQNTLYSSESDIVSVGMVTSRPSVTSNTFRQGTMRNSFNRPASGTNLINYASEPIPIASGSQPSAGSPTLAQSPPLPTVSEPPPPGTTASRNTRVSFDDKSVGAGSAAASIGSTVPNTAAPAGNAGQMGGAANIFMVPPQALLNGFASATGPSPAMASALFGRTYSSVGPRGYMDIDRPSDNDFHEFSQPSALTAVPETFRNRQRGSGGDLPSIMSMKRADVTRGTYAVNATGDLSIAAGMAGADGPMVDDLEPLCPGGLLGLVQTMVMASREVVKKKLRDPTLLVMHFHAQITIVHFVTWSSTYGFVGGSGPSSVSVMQFDDLMMSLMGLTGWVGALYYARGLQPTGRAVAMLERCAVDVLKFLVLYFVCNIGFTLAFYTLHKGTTYATGSTTDVEIVNGFAVEQPFSSIGYGMIQLVRFMYGEAEWDTYAGQVAFRSKEAFATIFFLLYVALVLLLLMNLLTAMIIDTFGKMHGTCTQVWQARWADFILRAEGRMPPFLQDKLRMGAPSYDQELKARVYATTMEVMEPVEDREAERDGQIRQLEGLLEKLKGGKSGGGGLKGA